MRKAVFTISNSRYLPQSQALKTSLLSHNKDLHFFHITPDSRTSCLGPDDSNLTLFDLKIDSEWIKRAVNELDIVEMSTAIKPFVFKFLFELGYESVIFLDPDIYVTSKLDPLFSLNQKYPILITPHLISAPRDIEAISFELSLLRYGTFNLGFICINNSADGKSMLDWWCERTLRHSKRQRFLDEFTDQKWINLVPSYFDCYVVKNPGCNLAPWNIAERGIKISDNKYFTRDGHPIIFVHFSQSAFNDDLDNPLNLWTKYYRNSLSESLEIPSLAILIREYRSLIFKSDATFPKTSSLLTKKNKKHLVSSSALKVGIHEDWERLKARFSRLL